VDKAVIQGVELRLALDLPSGFSIAEEALFLDAENDITGLTLFNRPDFINTVKLAYAYGPLGLKANFRIISTGEQYLSLTEKADAYTVCNLHISKSLTSGFKVYGGVNNLFNADPYFPQFDGTGTYFYTGISLDYM
jgi:outer membrane receptor for ferrienterochelin and colicins